MGRARKVPEVSEGKLSRWLDRIAFSGPRPPQSPINRNSDITQFRRSKKTALEARKALNALLVTAWLYWTWCRQCGQTRSAGYPIYKSQSSSTRPSPPSNLRQTTMISPDTDRAGGGSSPHHEELRLVELPPMDPDHLPPARWDVRTISVSVKKTGSPWSVTHICSTAVMGR